MRQITVRQLVRQGSKAKLEEWIPCEITADGVVIAILLRANDVRQARHDVRHDVRQARHDVNKLVTMSDKLNPKATHDVNKGMAFWNKAAQECLDRNARAGELLRKVQKLN